MNGTRSDGHDPATILDVTGGVAGVAATYDAVRTLADDFDDAGSRLRDWSTDDLAVLGDPALLASGALSPLTLAEAEASVLAAATGRDGLLPASLCWEGDAVLVRAAIGALEASDTAAEAAVEALDWQLGRTLGPLLPVAAPSVIGGLSVLPPGMRARIGGAAEAWAVRHPGILQRLVNSTGGMLGVPDNRTATALLAAAYDDGEPVVTRRDDLRVSPGRRGSVADLVGHLRDVAALSPDPDSRDNGTIEVQTVAPDTEHARHIVYLPGTDDLATRPWTADGDVRDLGNDLHSAAGEETAYQRGILRAMSEAGIRSGEPVLLVGHSLGGMEAAALASRDTGFAIGDVVTAGSPTAQVPGYPDGVHVLSLEHRGDLVTTLDGADNPDTVGQTTVVFADGTEPTVEARHGYEHYVAGAAAVDASANGSVTSFRDGLRDRGFLGPGGEVRSQVFQVVRGR